MPAEPDAHPGRRRVGRDIVAQLVLRASNLLLGVFTVVLLVRTLGDEGFGAWATAGAVISLVSYFTDAGLDRVAVERAASEPDRAGRWIGAVLTLRFALTIPVAVIAATLTVVIADTDAAAAAGAILAAALLTGWMGASRIAFQLRVRNVVPTSIELASGVLWAAAVGAVALAGGGLVPMAAAFLCVTASTSVLTFVLARRELAFVMRGTRELWRPLLRVGVPVGVAGLFVMGFAYIDQVIVYELRGAREAGLYGASYRILDRAHFLPATLMTTLFPLIVAARDSDPERFRRLVRTAFDALMVVSLPGLVLALAGPRDLVVLLFGEEFAAAAPALPVLLGAFMVMCFGYLLGALVIALGLQRAFAAFAAIALVFNVALNLLLVPEHGFVAAAWITLATEVLIGALTLAAVARRGAVPLPDRRLAGALGAAALAWAVAAGLNGAGVPTPVWAGAGALAYAGLLPALRVVTPAELRELRAGRAS